MPKRALEAGIGALVAALLGLAMLVPAGAGAATTAREASAFIDSIGVDTHTAFSDTPYVSEFATVEQRLEELGVHHVRDDLFPERPDQYQRLDDLAAAGVGSTLVMGSPEGGVPELEELLGVAAGLDGLDALEGPNEYSTSGDPEWKPHLIAFQQELYARAKADPALAALPVIGPSIVHGDQAELGDISGSLDHGNIHSYPQGNPPEAKLGSFIDKAKLNSGTKPITATETGYNTALAWSGENPPVSEAAMATYVPRLFFEYFRWRIVRTFSYELLDEFPDPDLNDRESNFGLLRNDLSRKPAFDALRNTIRILEDPGAQFAPAALDYTLSEGGVPLTGPEGGLHRALLQKRDGSFYLALWRLSSVWDPATKQALPAQTEPVEVRVEPELETAAAYLPNSSTAPVWSLTRPSQPLTVAVGPEAVILRLVPGSGGAEPPTVSSEQAQQPPRPEQPGGGDEPDVVQPPPAPRCVVPKLRGGTLRTSRTRLRAQHCRVGRVAGSRTGPSRVVAQRPPAGRVLEPGASVSLRLAPDG